MAEKQKKGKAGKLLSSIGLTFSALLLGCLIYLAAVLLQTTGDSEENSFVVREDPVPVTRMQSAAMDDAPSLSRHFGAPLPMLPGISVKGQGENTTHDGETVRRATLQYDGLLITAVQPASAAPLLLRKELSVSMRSDLTVLNLPAMLSSRGNARCVYFSSESTAYAIYAPNAGEEDFLSLLAHLAWAN